MPHMSRSRISFRSRRDQLPHRGSNQRLATRPCIQYTAIAHTLCECWPRMLHTASTSRRSCCSMEIAFPAFGTRKRNADLLTATSPTRHLSYHSLFWPSPSSRVYNPRAVSCPINDSDGPALPLPRFRFPQPPLSPPTDPPFPPCLPPRSAPLLLQPPSAPLLLLFHVSPAPARPEKPHPRRIPINCIIPRRRHILCTRCKSQLSAAPRTRHRPFRQQNHHCPSLCPSVRQERRLKASKNMESCSRETTLLPPRTVRITILSVLPTVIKRPFFRSTMGAPHRRTIYIASLEAHIDRLHNQLLGIGLYPIPFERLEPYRGLNSKTAKVPCLSISTLSYPIIS